MEHRSNTRAFLNDGSFAIGILLLAAGSSILASAKWSIGVFAWLAPFFLLYYFRLGNVRRKFLWYLPVMVMVHLISEWDVAPFPLPILLILAILSTLYQMLAYLTDKWVTSRCNHFLTTLLLPCAAVTQEFIASLANGTWWSLANSQVHAGWLIQLASVTGLWGISFIVYWTASVAVWTIGRFRNGISYSRGGWIYGIVIFVVLLFGAIRYNISSHQMGEQVRVAGLSVPLIGFMQTVYKDFCGKEVTVPIRSSITSGVLQEVHQSLVPFIEEADTLKFKNAFRAMQQVNDSLFVLSQQAADCGAKIICWSEANCMTFTGGASSLIDRGKAFALKNKIYLQMAMAVLHAGKITPNKKYLENEAILIGPDGQVLNVFHKNNPVPMAEASEPGDGKIPVAESPWGNIATSICYDADFPKQMRQTSKKKAALLLLPSGDWNAIDPYHSNMAVFRGIENGCSIVREVSGGLSFASDYRGRIHASLDFYDEEEKLWIAEVPVGHVFTIYSVIGDAFVHLCILATALFIIVFSIKPKKTP